MNPKIDFAKEMAHLFYGSTHVINVPNMDSYIGLIHTFFALEDMYGLKIKEVDEESCLYLDKSDYSTFSSMYNMFHT